MVVNKEYSIVRAVQKLWFCTMPVGTWVYIGEPSLEVPMPIMPAELIEAYRRDNTFQWKNYERGLKENTWVVCTPEANVVIYNYNRRYSVVSNSYCANQFKGIYVPKTTGRSVRWITGKCSASLFEEKGRLTEDNRLLISSYKLGALVGTRFEDPEKFQLTKSGVLREIPEKGRLKPSFVKTPGGLNESLVSFDAVCVTMKELQSKQLLINTPMNAVFSVSLCIPQFIDVFNSALQAIGEICERFNCTFDIAADPLFPNTKFGETFVKGTLTLHGKQDLHIEWKMSQVRSSAMIKPDIFFKYKIRINETAMNINTLKRTQTIKETIYKSMETVIGEYLS